MELVERYVAAVGRRLPTKIRDDVETELKSLIMDELDSRAQGGQPYTEEDVVTVLEEMGPPHGVAIRYAPSPRYLIGPQLYDTYLLVLGIVLGVVALGIVVGLVAGLAVNHLSAFGIFFERLATLFSGAMSVFAAVTLIFAVLERVLPDEEKESLSFPDKWNPSKLPPVQSAEKGIKLSESVVAICFASLGLLVFNLFSDRLGGVFFGENQWQFIPFVNQESIAVYRPYWNTIWVVTIIHHAALLAKRSWSIGSRVASIVLSLFSIAVLAFMINGPSLIDPEGFSSLQGTSSLEDLKNLGPLFQIMLQVGLIVALVATIVETAKKTFRLVRVLLRET